MEGFAKLKVVKRDKSIGYIVCEDVPAFGSAVALVANCTLTEQKNKEIAEKIGISRQAYAKWETGATVPDIEKCSILAEEYGVTLDSLMHAEASKERSAFSLAPKGKNIWGSVTMNDRGQIVIPKEAREMFGVAPGDTLVLLADKKQGIALQRVEKLHPYLKQAFEAMPLGGEDAE